MTRTLACWMNIPCIEGTFIRKVPVNMQIVAGLDVL